ncbi:nitrate- and nitrite sensing domain-containing protein [Hamadaea sp. NPDC050747]|uniref:sensor histidine kinase n=1 Tax=Hamadaea sp. NPDC050747 TaxID=3155789 RepID=UPI0033FEBF0A
MKRRSIRAKMAALVIIPLVALLGLWLLATALTVGPARNLADAGLFARHVGGPAAQVVAELQTERRLTVVWLAQPGTSTEITAQRDATDTAVREFRQQSASEDVSDRADDLIKRRLTEFTGELDQLQSARSAADAGGAGRSADLRAAAMTAYTKIIDAAYRLFVPLAEVQDPQLSQLSRTLIGLSRARELVAQEDALVSAVFAVGKPAMNDVTQIAGAIGAQRQLFADAVGELPDADRARYQEMVRGDAFVQLAVMEEAFLSRGQPNNPLPINAANWRTATNAVLKALRSFEEQAAAAPAERSEAAVSTAYTRIVATGLAGLISVALALWVGLRVSRSVAGRLLRLRDTATDLAEVELPAVVARLRKGERVEVAEAELSFGHDEIGEVGRAFAEVRRTAVRSAVDEAVLRHGLNEVFLNVARRSQTLLHRQLSLLDRMERRARDPQELEDLFRLDHLSTRMRRHAEDLVILAGGAPGRGWRHPVAAVDVIRGSVSEIEEYVRVVVEKIPDVAIAGRAVGDIIHLLAELVENGTSFSPPQTRVHVSAEKGPDGLLVRVADRGLGMTEEALAEANARLAVPPDFDPANSARLGLMVVARLAARHGITVALTRSSHGGVCAEALIPNSLIATVPKPAAKPTPVTDLPKRPSGAKIPVQAEVSARPEPVTQTAGSVDVGGLPRRSRQVPAEPPASPAPEAASPVSERTPQRVRANLAAFQRGTASGRASLDAPADQATQPESLSDGGETDSSGSVPAGDNGPSSPAATPPETDSVEGDQPVRDEGKAQP